MDEDIEFLDTYADLKVECQKLRKLTEKYVGDKRDSRQNPIYRHNSSRYIHDNNQLEFNFDRKEVNKRKSQEQKQKQLETSISSLKKELEQLQKQSRYTQIIDNENEKSEQSTQTEYIEDEREIVIDAQDLSHDNSNIKKRQEGIKQFFISSPQPALSIGPVVTQRMQMPPILMNKAEREYQLRQQDKDHNKAIMYVRSYGGIRAFDSNGFLQSRDAIILASEQEKRRRSEIACLQRCEDEDNERKKDRLKERQRIESMYENEKIYDRNRKTNTQNQFNYDSERIEDDYSNRLNMNALPNENLLEEALSSYSRALRSFAFF